MTMWLRISLLCHVVLGSVPLHSFWACVFYCSLGLTNALCVNLADGICMKHIVDI